MSGRVILVITTTPAKGMDMGQEDRGIGFKILAPD